MTGWFPDYLHGILDQPGYLPNLAIKRLKLLFGEGDPTKHIEFVRDTLMAVDPEHQDTLFSYFSGFPMGALDVMLGEDASLEKSLAQYDAYVKEVRPPEVQYGSQKDTPITTFIGRSAISTRFISSHLIDPKQQVVPEVDIVEPFEWMTDAFCTQVDPEPFFPEKGGSTRQAKSICAQCTVTDQCLDFAMQNDERFGIWGGLSERERRKLGKQRTHSKDES